MPARVPAPSVSEGALRGAKTFSGAWQGCKAAAAASLQQRKVRPAMHRFGIEGARAMNRFARVMARLLQTKSSRTTSSGT